VGSMQVVTKTPGRRRKVGTLGRCPDGMEIERRKRDLSTCDKGKEKRRRCGKEAGCC